MAGDERPGSVRPLPWPLIDAKAYSIVIGSVGWCALGGYQ